MTQTIRYRPAEQRDSRFIAEMIEIASDGIAALEWEQEADASAGIGALDVGARWYARDDGDYSYRNCLIAETGAGEAIGMILAFPLTEANRSRDAKPPPYAGDDVHAPYRYLEAVDSWYLCGITVLPEYRGQGIGQKLIELSLERGRAQGFDKASLIAVRNKTRLIAYYESLGFRITRSAPIVEHPRIRASGDAVLMETEPRR